MKTERPSLTCTKCGVSADEAIIAYPTPRWWKDQTPDERLLQSKLVTSVAVCEYCQYGLERPR